MFCKVKIGDTLSHSTKNKRIAIENYTEEIQKYDCGLESLDGGDQTKLYAECDEPVVGDVNIEKKTQELKEEILKCWSFIKNIYCINSHHRECREKDGVLCYSIHLVIDGFRCTQDCMRKILAPKLPNLFDKSVYTKNRGMYGIYTDKKWSKKVNKVISVPPLLPNPNKDFKLEEHLITYIEEGFTDVDLMYKDEIEVLKEKERKKEKSFLDNLNQHLKKPAMGDMTLYTELVNCLSTNRAEEYEEWLNVGFCLYNINPCDELLQIWINFSKKSKKFVGGECEELWDKMYDGKYTIGTLKWKAKQDNPEKYQKAIVKSLGEAVDIAIRNDGSNYDVANVASKLLNHKLKYDETQNKWYYLNDKNNIWKTSDSGIIIPKLLATEVCELFVDKYRELMKVEGKELLAKMACKIAHQLKSTSVANSIKTQMLSLCNFPNFLQEHIDSKIHLFAFNNKVFDCIAKSFRNIEPEDYIMTTCGYDWVDDKKNKKKILKLLEEIQPDKKQRDYLLKSLASRLYGKNIHQEFYILTGEGSNGKSILTNLISKSFGDYHKKVDSDNFTKKSSGANSTSEMRDTFGCRIVSFEEPEDDEKLQTSKIKEYSGDSEISVRGLYKEKIRFVPSFAIFGILNDVPTLTKIEPAIKRRMRIVDFPSKFCENPEKSYEKLLDITLNTKISNDESFKAGFISILIDTWIKYDLQSKFDIPESVKMKTQKYFADSDFVKDFIDANYLWCEEEQKEPIKSSTLYDMYKMRLGEKPLTASAFKTQVERLKFIYVRRKKGVVIINMKERDDEEEEEE